MVWIIQCDKCPAQEKVVRKHGAGLPKGWGRKQKPGNYPLHTCPKCWQEMLQYKVNRGLKLVLLPVDIPKEDIEGE